MRLSARNQLAGTVQSIKEGVITAEVVVKLDGGEAVVAVITVESVHSLNLKVGDKVRAIIKSTEILIATEA